MNGLLPHTGEGIVVDIGTGDGRFVSALAKANPKKFYVGIDANIKPLEKPSVKTTRKPNRGGLPNVLFVQAAVEGLPEELDGVADEIHIHFPWGSLLRAIAGGDCAVLAALRRTAAPECLLEIVIGVDPERDRLELERLGLFELSANYLVERAVPKYEAAGFRLLDTGTLEPRVWAKLETSWARKLQGNAKRQVYFMVFVAM